MPGPRDYITDRLEEQQPAPLISSDDGAITVLDLDGASEEHAMFELNYTGNRTFLTGTNITYASARGSSMLKLVGTLTMASGGFEGIDIKLATSGAFATDNDGVIGIKAVVTNSVHLADGNIYGAQFIAKHAASSLLHMHAEAALIGCDVQAYVSGDGEARTAIGLNVTACSYALAGPAGSVSRAIQIVQDLTVKMEEVSSICVWNLGGTVIDQVLKLVGGAFTHLALFTDDGTPAQSTSTTVTNVGSKGWIKVKVGAATRYIALGDGVT